MPATEVKLKGDDSPVTQADQDVRGDHPRSVGRLAPGIRWCRRSLAATIGALPRRFFLVDPLDGTKEFIKKRSDFTVNVALIEDGRPRFGLVYAPARALLAVTVADGDAVSSRASRRAQPAPISSASLEHAARARARPAGLTALVSLSHLDPETEAFSPSSTSRGARAPGRP